MGEVFVVGASSSLPGLRLGTASLAREVARAALDDAGVRGRKLTAVFVGSRADGRVPCAEAVAVRLGLRRLGLRTHWIDGDSVAVPGRLEHISGSSLEALHRAYRAVELEIDDLVLCIGVEPGGEAGRPWESWPRRAVLGARAATARRYFEGSGITAAQLARVVTKNRDHGAARGIAHALAREDVLDGDVIEWPLTRPMVAARGRGAAAVVLASARAARQLARTPARMRASVLASAGHDRGLDPAARAAGTAYRDAGLGPEDLDCAELHDATAAAELAAYEHLGIAPEGYAGELVDSGFTSAGGPLPVNLSGGLLSLGERPGACAIAQVSELSRQLRGEAHVGQVEGARAALAHCAGRPTDRDSDIVGVTVMTT
jgi:acetyl-CoA acetyltransferase